MTTFKKTMLVSALMAASISVQAGVYDISANPGTNSYHNDITVDATGNFTDTFNFSLPHVGDFSSVATSFDVITFTSVFLDGFDITAYVGPNIIGSLPVPGSQAIAGIVNGLSAGAHTLEVNGIASIGDQYTLNLNPISSVPEPSTLGLMFGGLALVGMIAHRSRKA